MASATAVLWVQFDRNGGRHYNNAIVTMIADAIIAMEGNGPLNGTPRPLWSLVLADDPVAADATCARLMGLEPDRIAHIYEASKFLGNSSSRLIDQAGESLRRPAEPFEVVPEFHFLRQHGVE